MPWSLDSLPKNRCTLDPCVARVEATSHFLGPPPQNLFGDDLEKVHETAHATNAQHGATCE